MDAYASKMGKMVAFVNYSTESNKEKTYWGRSFVKINATHPLNQKMRKKEI